MLRILLAMLLIWCLCGAAFVLLVSTALRLTPSRTARPSGGMEALVIVAALGALAGALGGAIVPVVVGAHSAAVPVAATVIFLSSLAPLRRRYVPGIPMKLSWVAAISLAFGVMVTAF